MTGLLFLLPTLLAMLWLIVMRVRYKSALHQGQWAMNEKEGYRNSVVIVVMSLIIPITYVVCTRM